jgi:hypothetical protein
VPEDKRVRDTDKYIASLIAIGRADVAQAVLQNASLAALTSSILSLTPPLCLLVAVSVVHRSHDDPYSTTI